MKTVLITGANRGLGKGFVEFFLKKDFLVFAGARNPDNFDSQLIKNKNLKVIKIDVSDDKSIFDAFTEISKNTNTLDYIINNAGLNKDSATNNKKELVCNLEDLDRESLLKMFNVNTISPILIIKTFLPILKGNPSYVINISSARGSYHDENENTLGNYGYRASKCALNMMVYCTLFDLPQNIRTFAVHPGSVQTDMNPSGTDKPEVQAQKIVEITQKWENEFNGKFLRYDGTIYPL